MADLTETLNTALGPPVVAVPSTSVVPSVRKAVIISQWTAMLDLVQRPLEHEGIEYERLDGSMAQPARAKALERFASEPRVRVLLLSLRAGGVGLNLVAAQTVYLLDPWWNPGVEEQAIDRVHRIGQSHAVRVKRFLMQHTVEDRILQLHAKKTALVKGALDARDPSDYKERATRLEDLKFMFS